jgi:hypothetical protein
MTILNHDYIKRRNTYLFIDTIFQIQIISLFRKWWWIYTKDNDTGQI